MASTTGYAFLGQSQKSTVVAGDNRTAGQGYTSRRTTGVPLPLRLTQLFLMDRNQATGLFLIAALLLVYLFFFSPKKPDNNQPQTPAAAAAARKAGGCPGRRHPAPAARFRPRNRPRHCCGPGTHPDAAKRQPHRRVLDTGRAHHGRATQQVQDLQGPAARLA